MKAGIIGTCALGILILISSIVLTISGRSVRQAELNTSLSNAIEQTMEIIYMDHTYEIQNKKEFISDFIGNLLQQINSDSDITIEILNLDLEEGLLDVKATEKYKHFTGREGIVTSRKTVILEEYADPNDTFYQVLYQNPDGSTYKAYTLYYGSQVIEPEQKPSGLIRWNKITNDGTEDTAWDGIIRTVIVSEDLVFRAVCH